MSCEKCKNLLNVPKNKKAWTVLKEYKNRGRIKEYTQELVLDHDEKGNPDAFITSQSVDIHGFWDNDVVENIKYCPFCGQKLY